MKCIVTLLARPASQSTLPQAAKSSSPVLATTPPLTGSHRDRPPRSQTHAHRRSIVSSAEGAATNDANTHADAAGTLGSQSPSPRAESPFAVHKDAPASYFNDHGADSTRARSVPPSRVVPRTLSASGRMPSASAALRASSRDRRRRRQLLLESAASPAVTPGNRHAAWGRTAAGDYVPSPRVTVVDEEDEAVGPAGNGSRANTLSVSIPARENPAVSALQDCPTPTLVSAISIATDPDQDHASYRSGRRSASDAVTQPSEASSPTQTSVTFDSARVAWESRTAGKGPQSSPPASITSKASGDSGASTPTSGRVTHNARRAVVFSTKPPTNDAPADSPTTAQNGNVSLTRGGPPTQEPVVFFPPATTNSVSQSQPQDGRTHQHVKYPVNGAQRSTSGDSQASMGGGESVGAVPTAVPPPSQDAVLQAALARFMQVSHTRAPNSSLVTAAPLRFGAQAAVASQPIVRVPELPPLSQQSTIQQSPAPPAEVHQKPSGGSTERKPVQAPHASASQPGHAHRMDWSQQGSTQPTAQTDPPVEVRSESASGSEHTTAPAAAAPASMSSSGPSVAGSVTRIGSSEILRWTYLSIQHLLMVRPPFHSPRQYVDITPNPPPCLPVIAHAVLCIRTCYTMPAVAGV